MFAKLINKQDLRNEAAFFVSVHCLLQSRPVIKQAMSQTTSQADTIGLSGLLVSDQVLVLLFGRQVLVVDWPSPRTNSSHITVRKVLEANGLLRTIALSKDKQQVAVAGDDKTLFVLKAPSWSLAARKSLAIPFHCISVPLLVYLLTSWSLDWLNEPANENLTKPKEK